jgi:hypothetical protein
MERNEENINILNLMDLALKQKADILMEILSFDNVVDRTMKKDLLGNKTSPDIAFFLSEKKK